MQELSAYLLEARNLSAEQFAERSSTISNAIAEWLAQKGVTDPTKDAGTFDSLTANGNGKFSREKKLTDAGALEEIRLDEFSRGVTCPL